VELEKEDSTKGNSEGRRAPETKGEEEGEQPREPAELGGMTKSTLQASGEKPQGV